jgi:hypothetical protein
MKRKLLLIILLAMLLLTAAGIATAHLAGYNLPWWTADSGGGSSNGGNYQLSGTIGQPDAGVLSGGNYRLDGGFWSGSLQSELRLFLPLVKK